MEIPPDLPHSGPNLSKSLQPRVRSNVHLIPVELLSEIFLLVVEKRAEYQKDLTLVCWRWHDIVLSTPGLHTTLRIRRATKKEAVQAFINGTKTRLDVFVDMNDERDGNEFDVDNFHACFTAAAQVASRWRDLRLISPPPHGEYQDIHITQPLKHLECFELGSGFGNLVEPLVTAISETSETLYSIDLADPAVVLYLGQPLYSHIFNFLILLTITLPRRSMDTPVDILPHIHILEHFTAHHLYLPIYPPNASLPFAQTLEILSLRSTSIQWMGGLVFPALKECDVIFPHHADTTQPLQPINMPFCKDFTYHSNDLGPLRHFHLPRIENLDVRCGQWSVWRGNLQLIPLYSLVTTSSQITDLVLYIQCSEQLLVFVLRLVPALQQLCLRLASPNALSKAFFQAFILREPDEDGSPGTVGIPKQTIDPLCPSLQSLYLHYKRWHRGIDSKKLTPLFSDIVVSRQQEESQFSFTLGFDEDEPSWSVGTPEWKFQNGYWDVTVGILCPHSMVPMFADFPESGVLPLPFKEVDHLYLSDTPQNNPIDFHFTFDHMELSIGGSDQPIPQTSIPCNLPLFTALRVLVVMNVNPSFLAGHTFHRLERCSVMGSLRLDYIPSQKPSTEMPVCTRLDIGNPTLLATLMLPQIHELGLDFSVSECGMIWENQILMNSNLSGLKLLHMRAEHIGRDLIQILQPLPLLETLIISSQVDVDTFRALNQSCWEGQKLAIVCPLLQVLVVEDTDPSERPELTFVLEDVVTLRKVCRSPLKSFTFYIFSPKPGRKFELIGMDGGFAMKKTVLVKDADRFELDM